MGKRNDFNQNKESYDFVVMSEVRDRSVDFNKLRCVSIGPAVGEIWSEDSLQRWEWRFFGGGGMVKSAGREWNHGLETLIEV